MTFVHRDMVLRSKRVVPVITTRWHPPSRIVNKPYAATVRRTSSFAFIDADASRESNRVRPRTAIVAFTTFRPKSLTIRDAAEIALSNLTAVPTSAVVVEHSSAIRSDKSLFLRVFSLRVHGFFHCVFSLRVHGFFLCIRGFFLHGFFLRVQGTSLLELVVLSLELHITGLELFYPGLELFVLGKAGGRRRAFKPPSAQAWLCFPRVVSDQGTLVDIKRVCKVSRPSIVATAPRGYVDARKGDEPGESAHGNDNSPEIADTKRVSIAPFVRYEGHAFIAFMPPWSPRALCSSRHPAVVRRVDGRMHPTWHGVLWHGPRVGWCPNVTLVFRVWFSRGVSYFGHLGPFSGGRTSFPKNVFIKTVSSSSLQNMHRARAPSRRRVLCENISHSPKRDVDDEERVPIASHRAYTYKTNIVIHNSLIASRNRTVVASRNRTVGRARARIFTRLLKALFGGNYHAEHLSGGGADPDLMSATHCGEKI